MEKQNEVTQQPPSGEMPYWYNPKITDVVHTGKVRNVHAFTGQIFQTSNRLSVFDRVIKEDVPLKGAMLNCISQCNKLFLIKLGFLTDYIPVPDTFYTSAGFAPKEVSTLSYAEILDMLPFEFIVRGYLVGSAYEAYKKGEPYCGFTFQEGLKKGDKLPEPIVTPTTKEEDGHDKPVTKQECIELLADWLLDEEIYIFTENPLDEEDLSFGKNASEDEEEQYEYALAYHCAKEYIDIAYEVSLDAFDLLSEKCAKAGILFIDTKFEFGLNVDGNLTLADEVGTPDSSRFVSAEEYNTSGKLISLDKQIVRDYCSSIGFSGDKDQPIPEIPEEIWEKVTNTYVFIAEQLCGKEVVAKYK